MTLTDASPLVALVDDRQTEAYTRCAAILPELSSPLMTTWPCFTEAMYLLYQFGGWPLREILWDYVETGILTFYPLTDTDIRRMRVLMAKYRDRPMDLADASLVAAAETLNTARIFTLDSDFYVYRFKDTGAFEVVP